MVDLPECLTLIWLARLFLSVSILSVAHIMFAAAFVADSGILERMACITSGSSPSSMIENVLKGIKTTTPLETCPICHDKFTRPVQLKCCKHIFCDVCIRTTLTTRDSCPLDFKPLFGKQRFFKPSEPGSFTDGIYLSIVISILALFFALASTLLLPQGSRTGIIFGSACWVAERLCFALMNAYIGDYAMEVFVGQDRFNHWALRVVISTLAGSSMVSEVWVLRCSMAAFLMAWTVPSCIVALLMHGPHSVQMLKDWLRYQGVVLWRELNELA